MRRRGVGCGEEGFERDGTGLEKERRTDVGVRAESGGTCKATMKAHRLNGSSRFVLIAVRMSRRFPWVIAASVLVKGKAMRPLC